MIYIETSPVTLPLSEAARIPMYFALMCLRLLYLIPLIGIAATPYAHADTITPLHLEPDQIQEERLPGEYRETTGGPAAGRDGAPSRGASGI